MAPIITSCHMLQNTPRNMQNHFLVLRLCSFSLSVLHVNDCFNMKRCSLFTKRTSAQFIWISTQFPFTCFLSSINSMVLLYCVLFECSLLIIITIIIIINGGSFGFFFRFFFRFLVFFHTKSSYFASIV